MKLVEINDKDEKEKTTYFVIYIDESFIPNIQKAIQMTWNKRDYTVADLKSQLEQGLYPDKINFIYDCTDEKQKDKVVELDF